MPTVSSDSEKRPSRGRGKRARPTFGFIVTWGLSNPYSGPIWWGAVEEAGVLDVNLIGFGDINIYDPSRHRSLYRQIQPATLDGVIIVNPTLSELYHEVFAPLPMVNIGIPLGEAVTSILVDNYDGMRALARHLIEVHGRRRLAFLQGPVGNPEAEERFQAYLDEVRAHGLTVEHDLLYQPADWSPAGGREGVRVLLEERHAEFDALIAANDNMALAAIEELEARGVRVPYDMAVAGFDDTVETATSTPSITTVRQPLRKMGSLALEALLAHYEGKSVPPRLILPTRLIVRRSCGCLFESVSRVDDGMSLTRLEGGRLPAPTLVEAKTLLEQRRSVLLSEMQRAMVPRSDPAFAHTAEEWLEAFQMSLDKDDEGAAFLTALDLTARKLMEHRLSVAELQDVLSAMRRESYRFLARDPRLLMQAENLWHRGRVFLNELILQQQLQRRVQLNEQMAVLRAISQAMAVTFHLDNLLEILARDLQRLGIEYCYLVLYEGVNRPAEWARVVLACEKGQRLGEGKRRYPTARILPPDLWRERRQTLAVEALEFQGEEIGFVVFEVGPHDGAIYEALRSQLGSSVKGALLFDERDRLLTKATRLYRQAAASQRLAEEANRLKSRFLSMVSHELRTPLGLITTLSEVLLKEATESKSLDCENLRLVHATARHLEGLIRDVLDLARDERGELRLVCEPLDLARALDAVVVVGEKLAREKGLEWYTHIPPDLPLVWGDPTRLRQVVLNLINNAVKFTEKGRVTLTVKAGENFLVVSVSDTGLGIPPDEQRIIFEEFRQSERASARGYGGLGLGLAICKRLVEMHGGEIGVRSSGIEGEGATFFFTLPTLQAISLHSEPIAMVWIVTPHPGRASSLRKYLEEQGFAVEIVEWGEDDAWLRRVVQAPPTAIVLDVYQAYQRCLEAMRALKAHPATAEVTVLFYALQTEQDSGALLELDYLTKPIRATELARMLQRLGWGQEGGLDVSAESGTILIVDDDPGVLEAHARLVRTQFPRYRILLAKEGREALQIMQTTRPDLVLLDLMMPEMDGFAVLEAMHGLEAARAVPVVVISAKSLTEEEMARLDHSVAAVLHKDMFTAAETLSHIRDALTRRQRLRGEAQRLTRQAIAYIHEHYSEPMGREDIARHIGVSEGYLSRCFTQETGLSLVHYLTRYRIQRAKQLLTTTEMTVTEIALEVGFSDSNYFSRVFRRETGVAPLTYRRRR